jgi:SNF2 family DNA or RNA helicase
MTMQQELFKPLPQPWIPKNYMKKGVKFLLENAAAGLLLDPGMSKTAITLGATKILIKQRLVRKVLVIAPVRVCYEVWPKEVEKWADFNHLRIQILHGPKKDQALATDADIYVVNYEGLEWLFQIKKEKITTKTGRTKVKISMDMKRFKALGFDLLVLDELHKVKNTASNRFKALKQVIKTFSRRYGLTGSPAANGLLDLFGQCYVLDEGRSLGKFVTSYRRKYFEPSYDGYNWDIRPGADEEIYKRVAPLMLRMSAADYLELPQLVNNDIYVDLPDDVMDVYTRLEDDLIAKVGNKVVTAATAATASMKCRQVANGGIYLDQDVLKLIKAPKSKREWVHLHTEKVDALADLIEELQGSPILVAYDFEHDLDRLRIKLGDDIPYIGGKVTMKRSSELVKLWNAGKLPYLFGHPQSVSLGLNLQEVGNHVCWHSLTWDYTLYDQFIRRILRQGNKSKRVFCHHILARGTLDVKAILPAVRNKEINQNAFFDALKKLKNSRK